MSFNSDEYDNFQDFLDKKFPSRKSVFKKELLEHLNWSRTTYMRRKDSPGTITTSELKLLADFFSLRPNQILQIILKSLN